MALLICRWFTAIPQYFFILGGMGRSKGEISIFVQNQPRKYIYMTRTRTFKQITNDHLKCRETLKISAIEPKQMR